ncbi:MAG: pyrroline-5-carboxylate reductase [Candidatus Caenarcaniphilales bacterium]|nr:pyrroline-5-carboxylate reductase [Candidatus Caenarcaniphilales bacterium]
MNKKIGIIGAGSMGSAIAIGLSKEANVDLSIFNRSPEKLIQLKNIISFTSAEKLSDLIKDKLDILIIAVKPKDFNQLLEEIKNLNLSPETKIISVAAGIEIKTIAKFFPENKIYRVMPNTPSQISAGMSAIAANSLGKDEISEIEQIFKSIGETLIIEEEQMHVATAIAGSGPAYFFKIIEALAEAGTKQGLSLVEAEKLAIETMYGAALLLKKSKLSPKDLRVQVTSPNGTTQAALESFEDSQIDSVIDAAVAAACKRSVELAKS